MNSQIARSIAYGHRLRDALVRAEFSPRWIRTLPQPVSPKLLDGFRLFAVIGTWMEEDVIEATVKNAIVQGVERVYVLDNSSTDATVSRAEEAGAVIAEGFTSAFHDEELRTVLINALIYRESIADGAAYIWWLRLDADEFPQGPGDLTVAQYLGTLDRRFRVVGATFFNHFPHEKPENLRGFHPIEFQPLCERFWQPPVPRCHGGHWKHPLYRIDRDDAFLVSQQGGHRITSADHVKLFEPEPGIIIHHFPFREESRTRSRLDQSFGKGPLSRNAISVTGRSTSGLLRFQSLDAVYGQRWDQVNNGRLIEGDVGVHLEGWTDLHPGQLPPRWYSPEDLERAKKDWTVA